MESGQGLMFAVIIRDRWHSSRVGSWTVCQEKLHRKGDGCSWSGGGGGGRWVGVLSAQLTRCSTTDEGA